MEIKDEALKNGTLAMADQPGTPAALGNFFDRLPEWVIDTLSDEQKEAIHQAVEEPTWRRSPVDIRLTIPFFGRKYYFTFVGGYEKRSNERRAEDRHQYPLRTAANIFFFIGLATLFYSAAIVALALQSTIVEF
ncbi:MAG: hypothetical protein HQ494_14380 [Rhodospirillales bacterium]|nr:hypothetical protein [Rhodospirillales bacterium]